VAIAGGGTHVQPHDHLFRAVFSEPEHAEGLLRAALPARLARQIDWTTLRPLRSSIVDDALHARYAAPRCCA